MGTIVVLRYGTVLVVKGGSATLLRHLRIPPLFALSGGG